MAKATDIPAATRKLVYARDGHRCRWCGRTNAGLNIHHIVYRSAGGGHHHPSILITLCPQHHQLVHTDKRRYTPLLFELLERGLGTTGLALERQIRAQQQSMKSERRDAEAFHVKGAR